MASPTRYSILGHASGAELWARARRLDRWSRCACLLAWLLVRSPWGRVLKAIREDEDAVRSLGKNVYAYKMQALVLGGVIGALGGMVQALGTRLAGLLDQTRTLLPVRALILGGAARCARARSSAPCCSGFVLQFTDTGLRQADRQGPIPLGQLTRDRRGRSVHLVGIALMLLLVFRPAGHLWRRREEVLLDAR